MSQEKETTRAILQDPEVLVIAGKTHKAPAPNTATIIRISELISELPRIMPEDGSNILEYTLKQAKLCRPVAEIAATLVIGAHKPKSIRGIIAKYRTKNMVDTFLYKVRPSEKNEIIAQLLGRMEIADFFALTTSLISINITKATKEVVTETTASGH